jgi:hypothetical protein
MELFIHKWLNPEYWPFWAYYFPVFLLWPILSLRGRSLLFFSRVNSFILDGGTFGESKKEIAKFIPEEFLPRSIFVSPENTEWTQQTISFPAILKPDVGERGDNIRIVHSREDIQSYQQGLGRAFLIQEFLSDPFEAGVMVARIEGSKQFRITSIVTKEFLSVRGDGVRTLFDLVEKNPRARFQWERLKDHFPANFVPPKDEVVLLEPVGNHCRGTKFLNGNHLLTPELEATMNSISARISGFDFGRFDLKAPGEKEFSKGEGLKILELNGAFSEPGHIYDPAYGLLSSWSDLIHHWWTLASLAGKSSISGLTLSSFLRAWANHRKLSRLGQ